MRTDITPDKMIFEVLRKAFPDESDDKLWKVVAQILVATADYLEITLE